MRYLEVACRVLLLTVFLVAAVNKIMGKASWPAFVQSLRDLEQLPAAAVRPAAVATLTLETLIVVLLLVPARTIAGLGFGAAAALLMVFTISIGLALARGNRAPCRCFGASRSPLGLPHLVRNLLLICVAALGLAATTVTGTTDVAYGILAGTCGLVLGVLITAYEDIVALFKPAG